MQTKLTPLTVYKKKHSMRFVKEWLENSFILSLVFWRLNRVQSSVTDFLLKIFPASESITFGDTDVFCYFCSFS